MSSRPAASSTASEIAIPRLPGESGCSARIARPHCVSSDGLGDDLRAPRLDHRAPARLLLVRDADHVDLALEPDQLAGERERAAPLARAGLGGEARAPFLLVVVGLRDRRVRLVAAGRADALVLVEDARAGADRLLEPPRTEERRRAPEGVELQHLLRNRDLGVLAHLLSDELHRKERREIVRPDRLPGPRVQHRPRGRRHVSADVVPTPRKLPFLEEELRLLHGSQDSASRPADRQGSRMTQMCLADSRSSRNHLRGTPGSEDFAHPGRLGRPALVVPYPPLVRAARGGPVERRFRTDGTGHP